MAETHKRRRLSSSGPSGQKNRESSTVAQPSDATDNAVERSTATAMTTSSTVPRRTLFVRSLPTTATNESLTEYFSQSRPLKHATVVVDSTTKQCKGYGFVTFADVEEAQAALAELNGSVFEGKKIKIDFAEPRKREVDEEHGVAVSKAADERKQQRRQEMQPPKLIVRNLPWSIAEPEQLAVLFRSFGKVKHAAVPKKGKRHAGFGFVVLRGKKNAEKAMGAVNGKEVDGRTLAVDWAVDKSVWEDAKQESTGASDGIDNVSKAADDVVDEGENGGVLLEDEEEEEEEEGDVSMTDADEDNDLQDAEEEEEEEEEDERNASTIFIRNLPFTATDESLYDHFTPFGPLRYARVVYDHETDRPRGTAFVCFWKTDDARSCVRNAPRQTEEQQAHSSKTAVGFKHSVLEDENKDPSGKYTMDGRVLQVSRAVSKKEADRLTAEGTSRREERNRDRRRLFLLSEGTIPSSSPLYSNLSATEVKIRDASAQQRQKLVKNNPMLHVSFTRLSVRNLPRNIDSKALKALARGAVVGFAKDVKTGVRQPLSKEELTRSSDAMADAEKQRKKQGRGIVRQAKVVFEGREGSKVAEKSGGGRSRGYGFIEYTTHRSALMGLRWLNGHAVESSASAAEEKDQKKTGRADSKKRMIVEFAIENAQVVNRRRDNEMKWRRKEEQTDGQETQQTTKDRNSKPKTGDGKRGFKRKRGDDKTDGDARKSNRSAPPQEPSEPGGGKDNQVAKRNRIIAKKRMARRARKDK